MPESIAQFGLTEVLEQASYVGLFTIVFAESGLFFGFFLPGDSILFTAGFLASQGILNIWILAPLLTIAAIGGDSVGFWTGKKLGHWLKKQKDSFLFKKSYLKEAQKFYKRHGGKTIVLARFIPAVRTFAPIAAGMAKMNYRSFLSYNIFGGILWASGLTLAGFFLGNIIPGADRYLLPIVAFIIIISISPGIYRLVSKKK